MAIEGGDVDRAIAPCSDGLRQETGLSGAILKDAAEIQSAASDGTQFSVRSGTDEAPYICEWRSVHPSDGRPLNTLVPVLDDHDLIGHLTASAAAR